MFLRWKLELLLSNHSKAKKSHLLQKEYILEKDISAIEKELDQQHLSEVAKESLQVALEIKTTRNGRNNPPQNGRGHFKI